MIFCDDRVWKTAVEGSQHSLVDRDFLTQFALERRTNFYQASSHITYKSIPTHLVNAPYAAKICSIRSGYDMPISVVSDANRVTRHVALVFQDPLRGKDAPETLSLGLPFALGDKHMRQKKRYGFVWELVLRILEAGFGVWITDARKFWLDPARESILSADERKNLEVLQCDVLRRELELVEPLTTVAFGAKAQDSLRRYGIKCAKHPHPGVWGGKALSEEYGLSGGQFGYDARLPAAWEKIEKDIFKTLRG